MVDSIEVSLVSQVFYFTWQCDTTFATAKQLIIILSLFSKYSMRRHELLICLYVWILYPLYQQLFKSDKVAVS